MRTRPILSDDDPNLYLQSQIVGEIHGDLWVGTALCVGDLLMVNGVVCEITEATKSCVTYKAASEQITVHPDDVHASVITY